MAAMQRLDESVHYLDSGATTPAAAATVQMSVSINQDRVIRRYALITYTPSVVLLSRLRKVNQIP
jgi:hypothetical protein